MKILYFTSPGNNLYIAKKLGGEPHSIPQLIKDEKYNIEDDTIGIIFPVYYFSVPRIVQEYLEKATIKAKYIYVIASYGSSDFGAKNALAIMKKILEKNDYQVNYLNSVCMVDNFLPLFEIETEKKIKSNEEIDRKINLIKEDIKAKKEENMTSFLSVMPRFDSLVRYFMTKVYKLEVQDSCVKCNVCTMVCPRNNIQIIDDKPVIGGNCELCLACVHHCSNSTISVNKEKSSARYLNEGIELSEIISSNKQW